MDTTEEWTLQITLILKGVEQQKINCNLYVLKNGLRTTARVPRKTVGNLVPNSKTSTNIRLVSRGQRRLETYLLTDDLAKRLEKLFLSHYLYFQCILTEE